MLLNLRDQTNDDPYRPGFCYVQFIHCGYPLEQSFVTIFRGDPRGWPHLAVLIQGRHHVATRPPILELWSLESGLCSLEYHLGSPQCDSNEPFGWPHTWSQFQSKNKMQNVLKPEQIWALWHWTLCKMNRFFCHWWVQHTQPLGQSGWATNCFHWDHRGARGRPSPVLSWVETYLTYRCMYMYVYTLYILYIYISTIDPRR